MLYKNYQAEFVEWKDVYFWGGIESTKETIVLLQKDFSNLCLFSEVSF